MRRKITAVLLASSLLLSIALPGCAPENAPGPAPADSGQTTVKAPAPAPDQIRVAYDGGDSMNPFKMSGTLNPTLVPLLYDSLTRPGRDFAPEYQLARRIEIKDRLCVIDYRRDARFSDGTALTGKDVIYSITTARSAGAQWKNMLQNVAGCTVLDDGSVEVRLYEPDAGFASLLTFPIIKEGTADADFPIGVSKFLIAGTWQNGVRLDYDPLYYEPSGTITTVWLVAAADPDALQFELRTGDIDLAYTDLSTAEFTNLTGSNVAVPLNHLVYLSINRNHTLLSKPAFRRAISEALNRDELTATAYVGHAQASVYPFHPAYYRLASFPTGAPRNLTNAQLLLEEIGLTLDENGRLLNNGEPVRLRLLVNTENSCRVFAATLIAEQMRQLGITIEIISDSFSQYQSDISNYQYDLFIGEVRLMDNMDISALLSGQLSFASPRSDALLEAYDIFRATGDAGTFCEIFSEEMPFIPLLFRDGVLMLDRDFGAEMVVTEHDLFYNIFDWYPSGGRGLDSAEG